MILEVRMTFLAGNVGFEMYVERTQVAKAGKGELELRRLVIAWGKENVNVNHTS